MDRYIIGRERTMENKPNGQEHSAAWVVRDMQSRHGFMGETYMWVTRRNGKQVISEAYARASAQAMADRLNAHADEAETADWENEGQ